MDTKDLKTILSDFVTDQFIKDNFVRFSTVNEFVADAENSLDHFIFNESKGKYISLDSLLASAALDGVLDEVEIKN